MLIRLADRDDRVDEVRSGRYRFRHWPQEPERVGLVAEAVKRGFMRRPTLPLFADPTAGAITELGKSLVRLYQSLES
jgi:hypothetical protein